MEQEGQNRVRVPLDPLQGMFLAQGTLVQHFIFAMVSIYILNIAEPLRRVEGENETVVVPYADGSSGTETVETSYLECLTRTEPRELILTKDHLLQAFDYLIPMHIACFTAILASRWISSNNKKSYLHNVLLMMTIPFY